MTVPTRPATIADPVYPARVPVLRHAFALWRWMRRFFSRRNISIRLLRLPVSQGTSDEPGLLILQVDGLAQAQLMNALDSGRMPFLSRLVRREHYRIRPLYSGQPATTPAVLGELFYGVPQVVPAFSFRDHRSERVVEMIQPAIASTIQDELELQADGLLRGGSAYCDIYSGGAAETHFCPSNLTWSGLEDVAAWRKAAIYLLNFAAVFRMIDLVVVELGYAVYDALTSRIGRRELIHELKFLPRRLIGGVAIRDLVAIAAEIDAARGLPAVHANFVGYDELAHRRGPDSAYAHRGLPAIDRALHRIWNAAQTSRRRDYHVWIMADHGQERTIPYDQVHGRTISDAVAALYRDMTAACRAPETSAAHSGIPPADEEAGPLVVAIGPLGFVYWPVALRADAVECIGARLSRELQIPIVMARTGEATVAWADGRRISMPHGAAELLGADHPHLREVAQDFSRLCGHPDAGHFVICGYRRTGISVSFVAEHGAHGGPGPQETTGFLMLPPEDAHPVRGSLRPQRVRDMGLELLQRDRRREFRRSEAGVSGRRTLRIATYNVHSCIGLDGRLSPVRIARVLAALEPDIVALQELDVCRQRSGCVDQAQAIADALTMDVCFLPCLEITGEKYGNAVLSRLPLQVIRAERLPELHPRLEPRGALWVEIDCGRSSLNLVTTHLSFDPRERRRQVDALLGPSWLGHPECTAPLVVCGDFNAGPRSDFYQRITRRLRDAQLCIRGTTPRRTWFSPLPLARIDHVLVSPDLVVRDAAVVRSQMARIASDHLPVLVEIALPLPEAAACDSTPEQVTRPRASPSA